MSVDTDCGEEKRDRSGDGQSCVRLYSKSRHICVPVMRESADHGAEKRDRSDQEDILCSQRKGKLMRALDGACSVVLSTLHNARKKGHMRVTSFASTARVVCSTVYHKSDTTMRRMEQFIDSTLKHHDDPALHSILVGDVPTTHQLYPLMRSCFDSVFQIKPVNHSNHVCLRIVSKIVPRLVKRLASSHNAETNSFNSTTCSILDSVNQGPSEIAVLGLGAPCF